MLPEFYNQLGAMHGTIMVFLAIVPLAVGAFGNYLVPLQIGAPDMAFPRLNMASYWFYFVGGIVMLASFFAPGGAAKSGWTSYPPLVATSPRSGQTLWLVGMLFLITSSLLGSMNFIVTIIQLRAPGMTWMRLPFFVWAQLVTSFLLLLAFPPLQAAAVLQLMDRLAGTSFFLPSGLVVSGQQLAASRRRQPAALAAPVLVSRASGGLRADPAGHRHRRRGHRQQHAQAAVGLPRDGRTRSSFIGFMSFIVWAHHMFLTGMGPTMSAFFQTTTMIISIPSVIILTALLHLALGRIDPLHGADAVRAGVPADVRHRRPDRACRSASRPRTFHLHDTYYVIGHFHYVVAPGTIFALFAGIYYWFPKVTGRKMNDLLGKLHFWPSLIFMNGIFLPMFIQGLAGVSPPALRRRRSRTAARPAACWSGTCSCRSRPGCWAVAQIPFIINFFWSMQEGARRSATIRGTPPRSSGPPRRRRRSPTATSTSIPTVVRGPYDYSLPGAATDFIPQHQPAAAAGGLRP